jgi:hypothetical protein
MFNDFYRRYLDIFRINFAILTLIPKEPDASTMKKFRPISVLNCSFKSFTNRLALIMSIITSLKESAFIKGRFILESFVTAHEIMHFVVQDKQQGLVLKLDNEKGL